MSLHLYRMGSQDHLVIPSHSQLQSKSIDFPAMIDSGATGKAFIDTTFAQSNNIPLERLKCPRTITAFDGTTPRAGVIRYSAKLKLSIASHHEEVVCFVTDLGQYPVILGLPWLRHHDPEISFSKNTVTFASSRCHETCLSTKAPQVIHGISTARKHAYSTSQSVTAPEDEPTDEQDWFPAENLQEIYL